MDRVIIVIENGLVERIFTNSNHEIAIDVIDNDANHVDIVEENDALWKEIDKNKYRSVWAR